MEVIFNRGLNSTQRETLKHIVYNFVTDQVEADRVLRTLLDSLKLGEGIQISSGGVRMVITDLFTDEDFVGVQSGWKDQTVVANQDDTGFIRNSAIVDRSPLRLLEINGPSDVSGTIDYTAVTEVFEPIAIFGNDIIVDQVVLPTDFIFYTGFFGIDDSTDAVYSQTLTDRTNAPGTSFIWQFNHPFLTTPNTTYYIKMEIAPTQDGVRVPLQVRRSSTQPTKPFASLSIRDYIDKIIDVGNIVLLDGTADHEHIEPSTYLIDATTSTQTINIRDEVDSSFVIRDSEFQFHIRNTTVNIFNADGVTIDHVVTLNNVNKSYLFFKPEGDWRYSQEGQGTTVIVASPHNALSDFPLKESFSNIDVIPRLLNLHHEQLFYLDTTASLEIKASDVKKGFMCYLVNRASQDITVNLTDFVTSYDSNGSKDVNLNSFISGEGTITTIFVTEESGSKFLNFTMTGNNRGGGYIPTNITSGFESLIANTIGVDNTSMGYKSLMTNTTGANNTAIGANSFKNNAIGDNNTIIGAYAAISNRGTGNSISGMNSLNSNVSGDDNSTLGISSLFSSLGSSNTGLGARSGDNLINGDNNTYIGSGSKATSGTASNEIIFGNSAITRIRAGAKFSVDDDLSLTHKDYVDKSGVYENIVPFVGGTVIHNTPTTYSMSGAYTSPRLTIADDVTAPFIVTVTGATDDLILAFTTPGPILKTITLDQDDVRILFYKDGSQWSYTKEGTGKVIGLVDGNIISTDFPDIIQVSGNAIIGGDLTAKSLNIEALNSAPTTPGDTGTIGEIRVTATHIFVCIATNTWVRTGLTSW